MSSFGDSNPKTRIEEELRWITKEYYSEDFPKIKKLRDSFYLMFQTYLDICVMNGKEC